MEKREESAEQRAARLERHVARLKRRNRKLRHRGRALQWLANGVGLWLLLPFLGALVLSNDFVIGWLPIAVGVAIAAPVAWWRSVRLRRRLAERRAQRRADPAERPA